MWWAGEQGGEWGERRMEEEEGEGGVGVWKKGVEGWGEWVEVGK